MRNLLLAISLLCSISIYAQRTDNLYKPDLKVNPKQVNPGTLLVKSANQRNSAILCVVFGTALAYAKKLDADAPSFTYKYAAPVFGAAALGFIISANINQRKAGQMLQLEYK